MLIGTFAATIVAAAIGAIVVSMRTRNGTPEVVVNEPGADGLKGVVPRTPLDDGPPGEVKQIPTETLVRWPIAAPDGRHVAVYDRSAVVLYYDLASEAVVWRQPVDVKKASHGSPLAMSPNGNSLLVCGADSDGHGLVQFLNTADGRIVRSEAIDVLVNSAAFSPNGQTLALGMQSGEIRLYAAEHFQPQRTLVGHDTEVFACAFSPAGDRLVSGVSGSSPQQQNQATLKLWDVAAGTEVPWTHAASDKSITELEFSADGATIFAGTMSAAAVLFDAKSGRRLGHVANSDQTQSVRQVECLASGKHALCAGETMLLAELPNCKLLTEFGEPTGASLTLDVTPDGRFAITTSDNEKFLRVWRLPRETWAPGIAQGQSR